MAGAEGGSEGGEDVPGEGLRDGMRGTGDEVDERTVGAEFEDEGCGEVVVVVVLERFADLENVVRRW